MIRRKEREKRSKKIRRLILIAFLIFLFLGLGREVIAWFSGSWDGRRQVSLAVESSQGDIFILIATPAKKMAVVLKLPANLILETPWFGDYQVDKLSLLAEQEKNISVFSRSLSYFLGLGVDQEIINSGMDDDSREEEIKKRLLSLFLPPKSVDQWRLWRYLKDGELIWKFIDLSSFSQEKTLPDGSVVLTIDPAMIDQVFWEFLSDPVIKEENLNITVFNVGQIDGLAQRVSLIIANMGGRVVEVGTRPADFEGDCLLVASSKEVEKTDTFRRLVSVFGCDRKIGREEGIGEIQLLIRNVKI